MEQQDDHGADNMEGDEGANEEAYVGEDGYDSEEAEEHQLLTINDDAEGEEDDEGYKCGLPQLGEGFESMYISESRLTGNADGEEQIIEPGSKTICQAIATIVTQEAEGQGQHRGRLP